MKKFIIAIILGLVSIMSYGQKFESVTDKNFEITKSISLLIDKDGESYFTKNTTCTIKNQVFGPLGNILTYTIKCNNEEVIHKSFLNNEKIYRYKDNSGNYNYIISDDMFHYFQLSNLEIESMPNEYACFLLVNEI